MDKSDFYYDFKPIRNKIKKLNLISALELLYPLANAKKLTIDPEIAEFLFINIILYAEAPHVPVDEAKLWKNILVGCIKLKDKITAPLIEDNVWRWLHTVGLNQLKASHNYYFNLIFRYYYIFSDSIISQHIERQFGIPYKSYFLCGIWLHSIFIRSFKYPKSYFIGKNNGGPTFSRENIGITLNLLSFPIDVLKDELRKNVKYDNDIFISHGYPHVTHPVFEDNGILYCMYADHLLTQITTGTYYLANIGNNEHNLAAAFGKAFEQYVGIIVSKNNLDYGYSVSEEIVYSIGKRTNLKTSDWIIETEDSIVFIECKTKKLRLNSKNLTNYENTLSEDMNFIISAIIQLYKVYSHYKDDLIPGLNFSSKKNFFPIVVTLEDWFAGSPDTSDNIKAGVINELKNIGIDAHYVDIYPFKTYSINQLELDIQLMFNDGFSNYFDKLSSGKITPEHRTDYPYIDYFNEEFDETFMKPLKREQT